MLYCTTPAKANSYAKTLSDNYLGKIVNDKEYEIFISHLERAYNIDNSVQDWSFFKVLKEDSECIMEKCLNIFKKKF